MVIWWAKANYFTTTVFSLKRKIYKKSYQKARSIYNNKCKFNIVWNIRNIRSLFQIKDNVKHCNYVVYEGNCLCGENYVGESVRNVVLRWAEHKTQISNRNQPNTWNIFLTINLNGKWWLGLLNTRGKGKF